MFQKILIANRGEIAVRVIRACRELNITSVAVYSEADRAALHVRLADEALPIGPAPALQSYLRAEAIVEAALACGAEAIHPGYGFLSERAHFARACQAAGLIFIGPSPEAIELLGDKVAAKQLAERVGVPTVPGYLGEDQSGERLRAEAERVGLPLLIKASAGGGGRGMRAVRSGEELGAALESARREAHAAFGDERIFLERLVERPRHVEVQVLADTFGNVVQLGERECSIQRRHQKIIEEAPCVALTPALRAQIGEAAVALATAASYTNAGTVEFLLDEAGQFYFLEMNTRLQVEHPVTELVVGLDLAQLQIAIAAGARLPFAQADIAQRGHAIEARVCAEDPATFLPAAGRLALFAAPEGPGIRNDAGVTTGDEVTVHYDPLIAKLIVHAADRPAAVARLQQALGHYAVLGVITNLPLLRAIAAHPAFGVAETATDFLARHSFTAAEPPEPPVELLAALAILEQLRAGRAAAGGQAGPWAAGPWRGQGARARLAYRSAGREYVAWLEQLASGYRAEVGAEVVEALVLAERADELALRIGERSEVLRAVREGQAWLAWWRGAAYQLEREPGLSVDMLGSARAHAGGQDSLEAPMPGTVVRVLAEEGQHVAAQQALVVLEAMKIEHVIVAPHAGVVRRMLAAPGALVARGAVLVEVEAGAAG